jgi:hypothetical protein
MIRARWYRRVLAAAVALAGAVLSGGSVAHAGPLFAMADASALVVRGKVERITPYEKAKLTVFRIQVTRALHGDVAAGETIDLAQEMLFPTTQPYFGVGTETLIFAVPLPDYSSFREALPAGRYWRWTERLEITADVAPLTAPELTDSVAGYLAVREDPEALADFVVRAIGGPSGRVRQDALALAGSHREVVPLLDARRLGPLSAWLASDRTPVPERAAVLVALARMKAMGVVELAEGLTVNGNPLQAAAVDALVTIEKLPPDEQLLAWSRSRDDALRLAAARGLAKSASAAALDRLAAMLETEGTRAVRLAIIQAVARTPSPRIVPLLAAELEKTDKEATLAAADALAKQGTEPAVTVLTKALEGGSENAQLAAAFALKRMNRHETDEILERVERTHPDPKVRRLCKLALGESMHEH